MDARQSSHENANTIGSKTVRMPNADMAAPPKIPPQWIILEIKAFLCCRKIRHRSTSRFLRDQQRRRRRHPGKTSGYIRRQPLSILSTEYRSRSRAAQNWNAPVRLYQCDHRAKSKKSRKTRIRWHRAYSGRGDSRIQYNTILLAPDPPARACATRSRVDDFIRNNLRDCYWSKFGRAV